MRALAVALALSVLPGQAAAGPASELGPWTPVTAEVSAPAVGEAPAAPAADERVVADSGGRPAFAMYPMPAGEDRRGERRYRGWRLSEHPEVGSQIDPRTVPGWVARDRRLTRAMIGTLAFACVMGAGLTSMLVLEIVVSRGCGPYCTGSGTLLILGGASFGVAGGVGMIAFSAIAGARSKHRRALQRWEARVAAGGLVLRF